MPGTRGEGAAPSYTGALGDRVISVLPVKTYVKERATECKRDRECVCNAWFGSRRVMTWKLKREVENRMF